MWYYPLKFSPIYFGGRKPIFIFKFQITKLVFVVKKIELTPEKGYTVRLSQSGSLDSLHLLQVLALFHQKGAWLFVYFWKLYGGE